MGDTEFEKHCKKLHISLIVLKVKVELLSDKVFELNNSKNKHLITHLRAVPIHHAICVFFAEALIFYF